MRTDGQYFTAILKANVDAESLRALRRARKARYPMGWTTLFRPALRLYRRLGGERFGDTNTSAQVLAAFDRRDKSIAQGPIPNPARLMDIIDEGRVRVPFAQAILRRKTLRAALQGHGVAMQGRKWSVDADALAMFMLETRWHAAWPQDQVDRVYQLAEEMVLTQGKVEHCRRRRALLDYYGRFARASLRRAHASGRVATHLKDS